MKKACLIVYIVLFFALLCLPMALSPFFQNDASLEKRSLAKLPQYVTNEGLNLDFSDQFEAWVNDHLPLRAQLLTVSNEIRGELLRGQTANVIVGRDGWLFYRSEATDYMNTQPMTDRQIRSIAVTLSLIEEAVTARGGSFTFVPAPNKASIYGEYMPANYRQAEETNLTRLTAELRDSGVNFTDLRGVLLAAKPEQVYHRRDSHWNYRGALIGWNAVLDSLGKPHTAELDAPCTVEPIWRGDLDKLLLPAGGVPDNQVVYAIEHASFRFTDPPGVRDQQAQLENYMSDREDRDTLFTAKNLDRKDGSRLYLVRDSFGRALIPFVIDSYETATFKRVDRPDVAAIPEGADLVYEIVERNLGRILDTAPFLYAPVRENIPTEALRDGGSINGQFERTSYGLRLYGPLPEDLPAEDGRVYIQLTNGDQSLTVEAFPIYERELLGGEGTNGYSAILSKDLELTGGWTVTVIAEHAVFHCGEFTAE